MTSHDNQQQSIQYLTFHLAGAEYAVGILNVKEIIEYGTLTKVPKTPPSIRGVINLRGNVVPVVDLALKFGLDERPVTARTCIVMVEVEINDRHTVVGIIVDSVSQVISLSHDDILPAPAFGTRVCIDFLHGLGKSGDKFVLLLNIDKILGADDLAPATASVNALGQAAEAPA